MTKYARSDEQDARGRRQLLPQVAQQLAKTGDDHRPDHEDRRDADHCQQQGIGHGLANACHEFGLLL